ncbi:sensor histidine kinase [Nitrosomonas sp.]|uniref:sensor histidine kinase n=1 Tax=Nitrosomonas sp. TaxID=42353 RepID=UPI001D34CDBF|nr:HAMP domain-containing sensor histidine kinase [Nitrosomonas sp.]MBX3617372.1 HAMP domain-containing histidine kinase [Nitrosomonas sp.]
MGISENHNPTTGHSSVEPNLVNFLISSVHDTKNSLCMLLSSLDKTLTNTDVEKLSTHTELVRVNEEARRINNHLAQLLTLYKLGQRIYPFDAQYICLSDFLSGIAAQYSELLRFRKITLETHVSPELHWYFDEDLINAVIGNAINNAIRYTRDRICIFAEEKENLLLLRVEDNGCGYPAAMLRNNNDFMYRIDPLSDNTGLGFYFSTMVVRMHQNRGDCGKLALENGGFMNGACFVVSLP